MNYKVRTITNNMKGVRNESYATKKEALRAIPIRRMSLIKVAEDGAFVYIVYPHEGNK